MKPMFGPGGKAEPCRPHTKTRRQKIGQGVRAASKRKKFSGAHFALVNEMLPSVSADGAYRMGLVSTLSMVAGIDPTRELFERAVQAKSAAEVAEWFEDFRRQEEKRVGSKKKR